MHPPATSIRATPKFSRQHRISRLPNIDLSEQNGRVVCSLIGSGSSYKSCVPLRVCQGGEIGRRARLRLRNRRFQSVPFRFKKPPVLRGENAVFGLKANLYQGRAETSSF